MVSLEETSAGHLVHVLTGVLQKTDASSIDKTKAYSDLTRYMTSADSSQPEDVVQDLCRNKDVLIDCFLRDVNEDSVSLGALTALGRCLHMKDFARGISNADSGAIVDALCALIMKTGDKTVCTRSLWCFSKQELSSDAVAAKLRLIISTLEFCQCEKSFKSMAVEHEALNTIIRLLEQLPDAMVPEAPTWGRLLYPILLHSAPKVRERAMFAMNLGLPAMLQHKDKIAKTLPADLDALLLRDMKSLMAKHHERTVIRVWCFYIKLLGKALHHGNLINRMLSIIEPGFKHSSPEVLQVTYKAWRDLIDNFALDPAILSNHRRVKLLMQVFRVNRNIVESVALEKLSVWWHFVIMLGEKASLNFDPVCTMLLQYCFGDIQSALSSTPLKIRTPSSLHKIGSPITPKMSLGSHSGSSVHYQSIRLKGAEIVALILGSESAEENNPGPHISMEKPSAAIIVGVPFFLRHGRILLAAVKECVLFLGEDLSDELLHSIWYSLVAHMKNALETTSMKDNLELFLSFLLCFKSIVDSQSLSPHKLLKLMSAILCLPEKCLSSSAYTTGDVVQGCPVSFLVKLVFNHRIIETMMDSQSFFLLFEKLVSCGMRTNCEVLSFGQTVVEVLQDSVSCHDNCETLWKLWNCIAVRLLSHIRETSEVNQGNTLEHNFSCLLKVLAFPSVYLFPNDLPQTLAKNLLKTWSDLYCTFSRLAAMVPNVDANISCEELFKEILSNFQLNAPKNPRNFECVLSCAQSATDSIDFSTFSSIAGQFKMASPSHSTMKSSPALGNLVSLCEVISILLENYSAICEQKKPGLNLSFLALSLCQILSTLFTHVPTQTMVSALTDLLSHPIGCFISCLTNQKAPSNKVFTPAVQQKVDKLWVDIVTCLQSKYTGAYDSDFLSVMSPMLAAILNLQNRSIRNKFLLFWNATFARGPPLTYPAHLKPILSKIKEKFAINLPGFEVSAIHSSEDTFMAQGDSQVPLPANLLGFPSPHKVAPVGSFLHKDISPAPKATTPKLAAKSPVSSAKKGTAKRRLQVEDLDTQDFVVIKESGKKKRHLTEHQKEVLAEHKNLPALYSSADTSLDANLMSEMFNTSSQSQFDTEISNPFSHFVKTSSEMHEVKPKKSKDKAVVTRRRSVRFKLKEGDENFMTVESKSDSSSVEEISHQKLPEVITISSDATPPSPEDMRSTVNKTNLLSLSSEETQSKEKRPEIVIIAEETQNISPATLKVTSNESVAETPEKKEKEDEIIEERAPFVKLTRLDSEERTPIKAQDSGRMSLRRRSSAMKVIINDEDAASGASEALKVDTEAMKVNTEALNVDTEAMKVNIEALNVDTEAMKVNTEAPNVDTEAMKVNTEALNVDTEAMKVNTEAPNVDTEAMKVNIEVPNVDTEAMKVNTKALNVDEVDQRREGGGTPLKNFDSGNMSLRRRSNAMMSIIDGDAGSGASESSKVDSEALNVDEVDSDQSGGFDVTGLGAQSADDNLRVGNADVERMECVETEAATICNPSSSEVMQNSTADSSVPQVTAPNFAVGTMSEDSANSLPCGQTESVKENRMDISVDSDDVPLSQIHVSSESEDDDLPLVSLSQSLTEAHSNPLTSTPQLQRELSNLKIDMTSPVVKRRRAKKKLTLRLNKSLDSSQNILKKKKRGRPAKKKKVVGKEENYLNDLERQEESGCLVESSDTPQTDENPDSVEGHDLEPIEGVDLHSQDFDEITDDCKPAETADAVHQDDLETAQGQADDSKPGEILLIAEGHDLESEEQNDISPSEGQEELEDAKTGEDIEVPKSHDLESKDQTDPDVDEGQMGDSAASELISAPEGNDLESEGIDGVSECQDDDPKPMENLEILSSAENDVFDEDQTIDAEAKQTSSDHEPIDNSSNEVVAESYHLEMQGESENNSIDPTSNENSEKPDDESCLSLEAKSPQKLKPSPTRHSPPPKAEIPSKYRTMSRASLILQKARTTFVKPATPLMAKAKPILKASPPLSSPSKNSQSPQMAFKPLQAPRVFSPSASPSAGILRKRRFNDISAVDSPSPPNKRRVCFSDKVQTREIPNKRRRARPRLLSTNNNEQQMSSSPSRKLQLQTEKKIIPSTPESSSDPDSMPSGTLTSTSESQLDPTRPIFPSLVDCDINIDKILHRLTSSVWMRGLSQLMRSKLILTIGHLSALPETEVHHLPIRTPKVETVRKVLTAFAHEKGLNLSEEKNRDLPDIEDELAKISKENSMNVSMESEVFERDFNEGQSSVVEISAVADHGDDDNKIETEAEVTADDLEKPQGDPEVISSQPETVEGHSEDVIETEDILDFVGKIEEMKNEFDVQNLSKLNSSELVQIHSELNGILLNVALALKSQCPSNE